jgi:hypothetical protein
MALIIGMLRNEATIKNVAAYIETLSPGGPLEARPNGVLFHWSVRSFGRLSTPSSLRPNPGTPNAAERLIR